MSKGSLAWCAGFGIRGEWALETANQPIASCQWGNLTGTHGARLAGQTNDRIGRFFMRYSAALACDLRSDHTRDAHSGGMNATQLMEPS